MHARNDKYELRNTGGPRLLPWVQGCKGFPLGGSRGSAPSKVQGADPLAVVLLGCASFTKRISISDMSPDRSV